MTEWRTIMKKIMILGAGIYQVPLIKKAKELGYYTIICSIEGNYPGFAYADKIYYVNTTDREKILEIAKVEQIDGICTTGTDVAVITVGYVCDTLGLSGVSFEAAQIATNKANMKKCFFEHGVPTARFTVVYNEEEAYNAFDELKKPVMMKIVDKSGSRGICRVDNRDQVAEIFTDELKRTDLPYIVMEEYIEGHEVGVDALVQNGEIKLLLGHDKLMYQSGKTTIPVGHILPLELSKTLEEDAKQMQAMQNHTSKLQAEPNQIKLLKRKATLKQNKPLIPKKLLKKKLSLKKQQKKLLNSPLKPKNNPHKKKLKIKT